MVALGRWFIHRFLLALKFLSVYVHRSTLPQLRCAQQLPQRGSREWLYHSPDRLETATLRAIFIAPTKAQKSLHFTIQRTTLPQSRIRSTAPSEKEPGRAGPFIRPPGNRKVTGDFHRPYESSEDFTFYHSTDDTPSEREPGRAAPSTRPPGRRNIAGDFHRPYESSKLYYAIVIPQTPGWESAE